MCEKRRSNKFLANKTMGLVFGLYVSINIIQNNSRLKPDYKIVYYISKFTFYFNLCILFHKLYRLDFFLILPFIGECSWSFDREIKYNRNWSRIPANGSFLRVYLMGRFNRSSCLSKVCVFLQILETIARKKFIENL